MAHLPPFIYLGTEAGYHALIKAKPSHFLVDEIASFARDHCAQHSETSSKRKLTSLQKLTSKHAKLNIPTNDFCRNETLDTCESIDANEIFTCDLAWCESYLKSQLSNIKYSAIEAFANAITDKNEILNCDPDSVILGTFHVKQKRLVLHRCISYLFPQLKSVTTPQCAVVTVIQSPVYKLFSNLINDAETQKLLRYLAVERIEKRKEMSEIKGDFTKSVRGKIHHLIGKYYGKFVETKTCSGVSEGTHSIQVRSKVNRCQGTKNEEKIVTAFTLWKKNTETHSAVHQLSTHLHLRPHMFSFAGNKDKRAITTQTCTVSGISAAAFKTGCETLPENLAIYDICNVTRAIRLGELEGNRFTIRMTKVENIKSREEQLHIKDLVASSLESAKENGFVNYFGSQRFGRRVSQKFQLKESGQNFIPVLEAPLIGYAMLMGDFKKAVNVLLSPTDEDLASTSHESEEAKLYFQSTGDVGGTLELIPHHRTREITVLRTLRRFGTTEAYAYSKALMGLTHNARILYVHSFCSWVWNEIATIRVRKWGIKVVPGDLALRLGEDCNIDDDKVVSGSKEKVFVVSEDDIANDRVHIKDIVLAVPGNRVTFSPNMKSEYVKFLGCYENEKTDSTTLLNKFRIPELKLNAPGTYRKLLEFPKNLSYRFLGFHESRPNRQFGGENSIITIAHESVDPTKSYDHDAMPITACVIPSDSSSGCDAHIVKPVTQSPEVTSGDQSTTERCETVRNLPVCDVELKFDLSPSCYATTFLQEVTKGKLVQ